MGDVTRLLAGLRGEQPPAVPYDPRAGKAAASPTAAGSAPDGTGDDAARKAQQG